MTVDHNARRQRIAEVTAEVIAREGLEADVERISLLPNAPGPRDFVAVPRGSRALAGRANPRRPDRAGCDAAAKRNAVL
jgi:hypothetical protein